MSVEKRVIEVLADALDVSDRSDAFDRTTHLFGTMPEFDSIAVVRVVFGIETEFDVEIDAEDLTAELFETVGSLTDFVEALLDTAT